MKILIVGRKNHGEKNDIAQLSNMLGAVPGSADRFEHVYFEDIVFVINEQPRVLIRRDNELLAIDSYDLIVLLHWTGDRVYGDIAFSVALYAQAHGIKVWNSEVLQNRSTTKLSQLLRMALAGEYGADAVFALDHELLATQAVANNLLPGICKDITASRGRLNFMVADNAALTQALQPIPEKPMILQALIPNDGSDLRFFVTGSKVGLVIRRTGQEGSHLNNVSTGGTAELVELSSLDPQLIQEVERVAKLFARELCGIDYIFDTQKQKHVFLEINGTPQIVNGVFATEKIQAIAASMTDKNQDITE